MNIAPCDNEDKHDDHNPTPTTWCPGAVGKPKPPRFVVTAHTGGGSMGEAMDPQVAVLCDDEPQALTLRDGMQNILSAYDQYGDWLVTYTPLEHINNLPTLPVTNGVATGSDGRKVNVPKGQIAIDLAEFIKSWHEDIEIP